MQKFVSSVVAILLYGANLDVVAGEKASLERNTTLEFGEGTNFTYSTMIVPETLFRYTPCIAEKLEIIESKKKALLESDEKYKEEESWENIEIPQAELDKLETCKPEKVDDPVAEEEARKVRTKKILNGYLEVDQNKWAMEQDKKNGNNDTQDSLLPDWKGKSIRICLQYFPQFDNTGDTTKAFDGYDTKKSNRYRIRFVNKDVGDFTFHSEVAMFRDDKNIDFGKKEDLESFCNKPFQPKARTGEPEYMAEITKPKEDEFGFAVIEQIINTYHRRFSIHFMRPLEQPEETHDLSFNEEETYKIFVNWGIYENAEATAPIPGQFYGYRNERGAALPTDENPLLPLKMKIQKASFSYQVIPSACVLFIMSAVFA